MCSASAPKAAAPTPKKPPRVLLSRSQFGDLTIPYGPAETRSTGSGAGGAGLGLSDYLGNFGRNAASGLRISGSGN